MGRKKLLSSKRVPLGGRVAPEIKAALVAVASDENRSASQMLELILRQSPSIRARMRDNGKRGK